MRVPIPNDVNNPILGREANAEPQQQNAPNNEPPFPVNRRLTFELAEDRRHAIKYIVILVFGAPPLNQWKDLDLVNVIMERLYIPGNSKCHTTNPP